MFVFEFDPWFPMTTISTTKKTPKRKERERKKNTTKTLPLLIKLKLSKLTFLLYGSLFFL